MKHASARLLRTARSHALALAAILIALSGTAYAGNQLVGHDSKSASLQRQINKLKAELDASAKSAKKKVKRGPAGPQGAQGPAGPPGTTADAAALKDHCAANTTAVGSSLCLDSTALTNGSYNTALTGCASRGERLPSISELNLARSKGLLSAVFYWADVAYKDSGAGAVDTAVRFFGTTGAIEATPTSDNAPYATCASSPTNG